MAIKATTRAAVFDVIKDRIEAATGATYDERILATDFPNGRNLFFALGPRKSRPLGVAIREQAGDTVPMITEFPAVFAKRFKTHQRETARAEMDAVTDSMQTNGTQNTAGVETRYVSDEESPSLSGEWIFSRMRFEARWALVVGP